MTQSQPHGHGDAVLLPLPQVSATARMRKAAAAPARAANGLSLEDVSNMLWAGFGLNCHGSGGRAVAGRRGGREVEAYVCLSGGCYRYDACDHALVPVRPHDGRASTGARGPHCAPAIALVYVTEGADDADDWEETGHIAGADVATIGGKVAAYASAAGLMARGEERFDRELPTLLGLHPRQRIALTQTIAACPR